MRKLFENKNIIITSKEIDLSTLRKIEKEVQFYANGVLVLTQIVNKQYNRAEWNYKNLADVLNVSIDTIERYYNCFDYIDREYKSGKILKVTEKMVQRAFEKFLIMNS